MLPALIPDNAHVTYQGTYTDWHGDMIAKRCRCTDCETARFVADGEGVPHGPDVRYELYDLDDELQLSPELRCVRRVSITHPAIPDNT